MKIVAHVLSSKDGAFREKIRFRTLLLIFTLPVPSASPLVHFMGMQYIFLTRLNFLSATVPSAVS